jgi:hypothetical protein
MKKQLVLRQSAMAIAISTVFLLTACGGGGGGGSNSYVKPDTPPTYLRTQVPYTTPVRVGTVDPLVNNSYGYFVGDTYTATITGSGQDVIIAGASTHTNTDQWVNTRLSMFSWQNGTLVDKTAQWFPNDSNVILGTSAVKFSDFFKSGRTDMFTAPYSDGSVADNGPAYVWTNTGTRFTRQAIAVDVSAHDSAVADVNGDGYTDIVILDASYPGKSVLAINDRVSSFRSYRATSGTQLAGNSIAVADFLNNGTTTFITTDNWTPTGQSQKLWSWSINSSDQLGFNEISILPTSRFNLPKWAALGITDSHNVRIAAHDFNSDRIMDAIVFSQPGATAPGVNNNYSEIQFLKNNGSGTFTDVTDTTLVGYNTNTRTTYQPKFMDLNGDGLTDILVSGGDNAGTSTQFLLKSTDGKYVATYANILTDYILQVKNLAGSDTYDSVNVVKDPNGKLYLVSTASFMNGSDRQLAVYISPLGSQSVTTAQTAINLIKQAWPYMTDYQANLALAKTSPSYINGIAVIDDQSILQPIGSLSLSTVRGSTAVNGFIAGVNLGDGSAVAMDMAGRSYNLNLNPMVTNRTNSFGYNTEHNDQYELTSHTEYLINGNVTSHNGIRAGSEGRNAGNTFTGKDEGPSLLSKPTQYTVGIPKYYSNGNWSLGAQYTYLNSNPFVAFGGSWGMVNNSATLDNVVTYKTGGFSTQASIMRVTTNITPGLITKVNDTWATWAETGYRFGDARSEGNLGLYVGVKPVVLSGSVDAKLPTAVDNRGNIMYTNKTLAIQNQTTGYVRALYTNQLSKTTQLRLSALGTADGQYRAMTEFKFWLD